MTERNSPSMAEQHREPEYAAYVAIDWADKKHYWSLRLAGGNRIERGELDNTPEAVQAWVTELSARLEQRPLAVALEQRRGALVAMLSKYGQLHLYPVHPATLAKYREAWYPSGSKDDVKDADQLLEIVCKHRERLRRLDPDTTEIRLLQFRVENRRQLVDQRTAISNRLTDLLKTYFPQILGWFPALDSPLVGELLKRWPSLQDLQKARPSALEKFLRQQNYREEGIQQRIEQIRQAIPATDDEAVIDSAQSMTLVYVQLMAELRQAISELEKRIAELAGRQADYAIFESLPGAGKALAPRLMAGLGSRRERFQSAGELQCYVGIAPVKEASGNSQWVHMRWACSKFLRQSFHEWAACSIPHCAWAKDYYTRQRAKNKSHHTAVRALAFKWIRILYHCWKDRQPYREEVHLANLAKRAVNLTSLAKSVQMP
jgi:transposase